MSALPLSCVVTHGDRLNLLHSCAHVFAIRQSECQCRSLDRLSPCFFEVQQGLIWRTKSHSFQTAECSASSLHLIPHLLLAVISLQFHWSLYRPDQTPPKHPFKRTPYQPPTRTPSKFNNIAAGRPW